LPENVIDIISGQTGLQTMVGPLTHEEHDMGTRILNPSKVEEVADKANGYLSGAGVSALVYLGDRLGLYRALSEARPSTSVGFASAPRAGQRGVGAPRRRWSFRAHQ
jgi:hypothetical protein